MMDSAQRLRMIIALWLAYGSGVSLLTLNDDVKSEEIVFCLVLGLLVIGGTAELAKSGGIKRLILRLAGRNSTFSPPSDG